MSMRSDAAVPLHETYLKLGNLGQLGRHTCTKTEIIDNNPAELPHITGCIAALNLKISEDCPILNNFIATPQGERGGVAIGALNDPMRRVVVIRR